MPLLGVDINPRFFLFSLVISGIFAYILQNLGILLHLTSSSPLLGLAIFLMTFAIVFNVIYAVAVYEVNEDEYTNRIYIFVTIAFVLAAIFLYFISPIIFNILK
jgi:ABC-type nickel/cobalt efflux system permease component RcnA